MALSGSPSSSFGGGTACQERTGIPNDLTTYKDLEWPGRTGFEELGELYETAEISGGCDPIVAGFFFDAEPKVWFVASWNPRAVGMGQGRDEALGSWLEELKGLREIARRLKPPLGRTTEKDVAALRGFFGGL